MYALFASYRAFVIDCEVHNFPNDSSLTIMGITIFASCYLIRSNIILKRSRYWEMSRKRRMPRKERIS